MHNQQSHQEWSQIYLSDWNFDRDALALVQMGHPCNLNDPRRNDQTDLWDYCSVSDYS